jgi:hypothetical protein
MLLNCLTQIITILLLDQLLLQGEKKSVHTISSALTARRRELHAMPQRKKEQWLAMATRELYTKGKGARALPHRPCSLSTLATAASQSVFFDTSARMVFSRPSGNWLSCKPSALVSMSSEYTTSPRLGRYGEEQKLSTIPARACVRACVRARARARMCVCVCVCVCVYAVRCPTYRRVGL